MSQQPQPDPSEIILSATDINRAGAEGVISQSDADRLIHWAYDQRFKGMLLADPPLPPAPEKAKGFNLVMVLYYFGALLMISACAWFLGAKWDVLGASGICITAIIYIGITASTGFWLRRQGYVVAGGLLVTVAVSLAPLLIYSIERMTGFGVRRLVAALVNTCFGADKKRQRVAALQSFTQLLPAPVQRPYAPKQNPTLRRHPRSLLRAS